MKHFLAFHFKAAAVILLVMTALPCACLGGATTRPDAENPRGQVWSNRDSTDAVLAVDFSPDGKWLAAGSQDHSVRVFDARSGQVRLILRGHLRGVPHVAFCGDGTRLATGGVDGEVRVWSVSKGDLLAILRQPMHVHSLAISRDGRRVATGGCDNIVRIWDVDNEVEVRHFEVPSRPWALDLSDDGRRLLVGTGDPEIPGQPPRADVAGARLFDADTGTQLHVFPSPSPVKTVRFEDNHTILFCVGNIVQMVDANTFQPGDKITVAGNAFAAMGLARDRKAMVISNNSELVGRNFRTRVTSQFKPLGNGALNGVAVSPDGRYVASGSGGMGDPYAEGVWLATDGNATTVWDLSIPMAPQIRLLWPHLGAFQVSAGADVIAGNTSEGLSIADRHTGKLLRSFRMDCGKPVLSPDGRFAIGLDESVPGGVPLVDVATGRVIRRFQFPLSISLKRTQSLGWPLAFSPDGASVFAAFATGDPTANNTFHSVRGLYRFDVANGKLLRDYHCPDKIGGLVISPDCKMVAAWRADDRQNAEASPRDVVVWNIADGKQLFSTVATSSFNNTYCITLSATGRLAIADGANLDVWDVSANKRLFSVGIPEADLCMIAFAPDARSVLTVSAQGIVSRRDSTDGRLLGAETIITRSESLKSGAVLFGPDGKISILDRTQISTTGL